MLGRPQTGIGAHLAFFFESSPNILIEHLAIGDESSQRLDVFGCNDHIHLERLSGVEDMGRQVLNLSLDSVGAGHT